MSPLRKIDDAMLRSVLGQACAEQAAVQLLFPSPSGPVLVSTQMLILLPSGLVVERHRPDGSATECSPGDVLEIRFLSPGLGRIACTARVRGLWPPENRAPVDATGIALEVSNPRLL